MNVQAVKDWLKALPKEEGDSCVVFIASSEDYVYKVNAEVDVVASMFLNMGMRNLDFGRALILAVTRFAEKGVEE